MFVSMASGLIYCCQYWLIGTESSHDVQKERPKLNLQKRSKPIEEAGKPSERSSSIFGNAKPVDTAAREREIEERLLRQREMEIRQAEEEKENRDR